MAIVIRRPLLALAGACVAFAAIASEPMTSVAPDELQARRQQADASLYVLDVRTPEEFVAGHVPGAVNIPFDQMAARFDEVPKDKDVVLYCRSGRRVGLAAEVLANHGYTRLQHLEGDIGGWVGQGHPVAKPEDAAACVAALSGGQPAGQACAPE
jgi:rhodanese-related sulfurtransferase